MVTGKGLLKAVKAVIAAPFKALVWLWFSLMRVVLYAGLVAVLFAAVVMGHGLWHMSHPLDNPKFKGLTYWQLLEWEKMVTDRQAVAWNRAHPNRNPTDWQTCVGVDGGIDVFVLYPRAALANLPVLFHNPTIFFQTVDKTWEGWPISGFSPYGNNPNDPCIFGYIPTPEQLEQYKLEYQAWKAQQEAASQAGK